MPPSLRTHAPSGASRRPVAQEDSKGEAQRLKIPAGLDELPWPDLDFLGWRDPGAPERAYLVAEHDDRLVGVTLRAASAGARGFTSRSLCSLCLTTRSGGGVVQVMTRDDISAMVVDVRV
jgi:treble-clef zinc-finger protein